MTRFEDMPAQDLRAELADWTAKALLYSREFVSATESSDLDWEQNMKVALKDALDRVRRIERMLKLGVAA